MGLAAEILWSRSRSDSPARGTIGDPAEVTGNFSEGLAADNLRWLLVMFRVGMLMMAAFQAVDIVHTVYLANIPESVKEPAALEIDLFTAALPCLGFAISFSGWFASHWRGVTLALCMALIGQTVLVNVMRHENVPVFVVTLLLLVGTGALVPWGERWQAGLSVFSLTAFAVDQALTPAADSYVYLRWLGMITGALVAQNAVHLSGVYRRGLAERYAALVQSERRSAESEAKLRKIFESTSDAIVIFSLVDGRTIEVNSEFTRVTGYTREEALTAPHGKLPVWGNKELGRRFIHELETKGILRNLEAQVRNRDGTLAPFLLSGSTVELDGELCAITIARDIAALKRTQNELIAAREQALIASRAKSEFLSSMSHEIRTPMNAVLGMAEVLSETNLDADQVRYLETMRFNGSTLLTLLDDILDLAKVESGRLQLEMAEFDLGDLVEQTVETLAVRAHGKGLELVARIAPGTPTRRIGDPLRLRQVLMNLLGNAIKFTEMGAVELTVAAPDGAQHGARNGDEDGAKGGVVRFSVADTGVGIETAKLGAIFSNFSQGDSSDTRKYGGSGLGLAIATRLVALMGGRIRVESEHGKGSTFHFTAPLEVSNTMSENTPVYDLHGLSALVADRNATNRRVFVETLGHYGATVAEATTVQETIAALSEALRVGRPFDLVFGDCQMPGIEQIERLATDGCTCGAAMIIPMLTTDDLTSKLARVRRLGFKRHLLKPVRRSDLLEVIARAARNLPGRAPLASNGHPDAATAPPLTVSPPAPLTPSPAIVVATASPAATTRPLRILLADDSPDNRLLIPAYFKRLPYQVETAENGKVAVEKFTSGRYDVVLMDIQMPVMDGYTAVRTIRAWETEHRRPATPILALTASTLDEDIPRAFEAGCDAHIAKPVRKATLLAAIDETLALLAAGASKPAPAAPAEPSPAETRVNGVPH
jgi:two-component system, sensor histidine kinase and response regulator